MNDLASQLYVDLKRDIQSDVLTLHYQPIFDHKAEKIVAVEALARWRHPMLGNIPPSHFIPLAEEFGVITMLGDWVINRACEQLREWQQGGLPISVSVNVSPLQLSNLNFATTLLEKLKSQHIHPKQLIIEITESKDISKIPNALYVLDQLSQFGVNLSIDDFGMGHTSLRYINKLNVNAVKIDRSLIQDLSNLPSREVVKSIMSLCKNLDIHLIAEGIETLRQKKDLVDLGFTYMQGYYFCPPLPIDEFNRRFL